jgi:hypothetical protein
LHPATRAPGTLITFLILATFTIQSIKMSSSPPDDYNTSSANARGEKTVLEDFKFRHTLSYTNSSDSVQRSINPEYLSHVTSYLVFPTSNHSQTLPTPSSLPFYPLVQAPSGTFVPQASISFSPDITFPANPPPSFLPNISEPSQLAISSGSTTKQGPITAQRDPIDLNPITSHLLITEHNPLKEAIEEPYTPLVRPLKRKANALYQIATTNE